MKKLIEKALSKASSRLNVLCEDHEIVKAAKYEIQNLQLVAQYCFVASFRRCFPFFTLHDQLVAQHKHLLRVEESCCEK